MNHRDYDFLSITIDAEDIRPVVIEIPQDKIPVFIDPKFKLTESGWKHFKEPDCYVP